MLLPPFSSYPLCCYFTPAPPLIALLTRTTPTFTYLGAWLGSGKGHLWLPRVREAHDHWEAGLPALATGGEKIKAGLQITAPQTTPTPLPSPKLSESKRSESRLNPVNLSYFLYRLSGVVSNGPIVGKHAIFSIISTRARAL
jgi:hypothetical protein